jgi:hypothetical protein
VGGRGTVVELVEIGCRVVPLEVLPENCGVVVGIDVVGGWRGISVACCRG